MSCQSIVLVLLLNIANGPIWKSISSLRKCRLLTSAITSFAVRRKSRLLRMSRRRLVNARLPQPVLQPFARLSGEVVRVRVGDDTLRTLSRELGQPACSLTLVGRPEDEVQHAIADTELFRRRHEIVHKADEAAERCSCCGDSTEPVREYLPDEECQECAWNSPLCARCMLHHKDDARRLCAHCLLCLSEYGIDGDAESPKVKEHWRLLTLMQQRWCRTDWLM